MSTSEQLKSPRTWVYKQRKKPELYSKAKVKVAFLLTWCLHFIISNLAIPVEAVHILWIIVTCTWPVFSVLCEMISQVWIFLLQRGSDWHESHSARIYLPPLTAERSGGDQQRLGHLQRSCWDEFHSTLSYTKWTS